MQVKAAVVHVDGANHRLFIVADKIFGMDEAGRELEDAHARLQKLRIKGLRHGEGIGLVRNAGHEDPHVHAASGRIGQRGHHLVVQDQVWRRDVHIAFGIVDDVHVNGFPHMDGVHGTVRVGNDEALSVPRFGLSEAGKQLSQRKRLRKVGGKIRVLFLRIQVPGLKEHAGKASDRIASQADGAVLPVAVARLRVDVGVLQIDAAGKGGVTVHHRDLAVVPVVLHRRQDGPDLIEGPAADAVFFQRIRVMPGIAEGAGPVIEKTHLHAGGGLFLQDLQNGGPHFPVQKGEIFHENEGLRPAQLLQQGAVHGLAAGIIPDLRIVIDREMTVFIKIMGQIGGLRTRIPKPRAHRFVLPGVVLHFLIQIQKQPVDDLRGDLIFQKNIEQHAEDGEKQDGKHPGKLVGRIPLPVDDHDEGKQSEQRDSPVGIGKILAQSAEQDEKDQELNDEQQHDHGGAAEQEPFDSLFSGIDEIVRLY